MPKYISLTEAVTVANYAIDEHPYDKDPKKPETYSEYNQGWNDACDYIQARLEQLPIAKGVTIQRWIPVTERVPTEEDANPNESVLAINKDDGFARSWIWDIVARWPQEFTHWMPLPQPPKGE